MSRTRTCVWCESPYDLRIRHGMGKGRGVQWICKRGRDCVARCRVRYEAARDKRLGRPPVEPEVDFMPPVDNMERDEDGMLWAAD